MKRKLNHDDVPEVINDNDGQDPTPPKASFASFGLDARLLQAVHREKFSTPTLVQTKAIPLALSGKDILARAKTGSGKTLAYLLPILHSILHHKSGLPKTSSSKHSSALILVPTKELATQVTLVLSKFTAFCFNAIRCENITRKEDSAVTRARLAERPDVVVATPSRASQWVNSEDLRLHELKHLVIDEADLVLSYGYEEDLTTLSSLLPSGVQTIIVSATLTRSTSTLTSLLCRSGKPVTLDLTPEENAEKQQLSHYVLATSEEDKFLLIYAIFKLQLIIGKVIVFVGGDVERCYRVRLFLEQFGVRSVVLNKEMPVNNRQHVMEEFNRGVYDILIAADEAEVVGREDGGKKRRKVEHKEEEAEGEEEEDEDIEDEAANNLNTTQPAPAASEEQAPPNDTPERKPKHKPFQRKHDDEQEYTSSRGLDFRHVACVLNFDLPTSAKSYIHRTGRTARGGQTGMALSFYVPRELYRTHKATSIPQCAHDERVLGDIKRTIGRGAGEGVQERLVKEWAFDMAKLEPFRYRFSDALRGVTRIAVREARTRELRNELLKSEKLKRHFEENPQDLKYLRHDGEVGHGVRQRPHLKNVPGYLMPEGGRKAVAGDVGVVGLRGVGEGNRIRKFRELRRGKGKGKAGKGRSVDPLRSLRVGGGGRK